MYKILAISRLILGVAAFIMCAAVGTAKADALGKTWALDSSASQLNVEWQHSGSVTETHAFDAIEGTIESSGTATIKVRLESLDTKNDLRDVRLRFLFFETFSYPDATITAQINRTDIAEIREAGEKTMTLPFMLNLHGVAREMRAEVSTSLGPNAAVRVSSVEPILIRASDFAFEEGLERLENAFYGEIDPEFSVSFTFIFQQYETDLPLLVAEPDMTPEACQAQLFQVTTAGQVTFKKGSYDLTETSKPMLAEVVEVANKCDSVTITVEGHTDSVGKDSSNQALSERRAESVAKYLVQTGLAETRVTALGQGEKFPVAPNDTAENRAKNRRIEFRVDQVNDRS